MTTNFNTKNYMEHGGDKNVIDDGGEIEIRSAGVLDLQAGSLVNLSGTNTIPSGGTIDVESGGVVTLETGAIMAVESGGALNLEAGSKMTTPVVSKAANHTVLASESGTIFLATAVDVVFTLPSTANGLKYTFITHTPSGGTGLSIDPAALDAIHFVTSVDDKDLINTGATDVEGDMVEVVGDGDQGWWVTAIQGIWAKEA